MGGWAPHTIHEQGTMNQGLWLLTNQLYRPSFKSITPTLCFGFAVDGGGGAAKSQALVIFWSIPKKGHRGEAAALKEGPIPDAGNAIRNRDAHKAPAILEGIPPNAGNAIRNRDARQAAT